MAKWRESLMKGHNRSSTTIWATIAIGATAFGVVLAFVAGFFLGHFTGGTDTTTTTTAEADAAETAAAPEETETEQGGAEEGGESGTAEPGAQVFISAGCGTCHTFAAAGTTGTVGPNLDEFLAPDDDAAAVEEMIVDPEAEIAEGYAAGVMPKNYGQSIEPEELEQLVQFLVDNSPAGGTG
jgi:hypothetical protein